MDIYSLMAETITANAHILSAATIGCELADKLDTELDKKYFSVVLKVAALYTRYDADRVTYALRDGKQETRISILSDDDYKLLNDIDLEKLPPILALRIADIFWTEKRNYAKATIAVRKSYELFSLLFDEADWSACIPFIEHAIGLAAVMQSRLKDEYLKDIHDRVVLIDGKDSGFLSLRLIGVLVAQKWKDFVHIMPMLDDIISNSEENINKVKEAFSLKIKIHRQQGKTPEAKQCSLLLAKFLEACALKEKSDEPQGAFRAQRLLIEAIHLYRDNGDKESAKCALTKLIEVQKNIPNLMVPITSKVDVTDSRKIIDSLFSGKSIQEQVIRLALLAPIYKKSDIKEKVLSNATNPIAAIFGMNILSQQGQTVATLPALNISNPEENMEALEQHMYYQLHIEELARGATALRLALDLIREENSILEEDLNFLIIDNSIIPKGRERIFRTGLFYGMKGDTYLALHILAPQVENMLREAAQKNGAIVTTLKDDDTSDVKLLSSLLKLPELTNIFGEDILFMLAGLMNERVGANIRNKIAHGIMSEYEGNDHVAVFFFCLILRIITFYSQTFIKKVKYDENESPFGI